MAAPHIPPAGTTEIGTADLSPNPTLPLPPVIRADLLNYRAQELTSVVRDQDPTDAAVVEALWRVRGSGAAVQNTGSMFAYIEKIDDNIESRVKAEATNALKRLIQRGDITIRKITVPYGSDWAEVIVDYVNNRTPLGDNARTAKRRLPEEIEDGTI